MGVFEPGEGFERVQYFIREVRRGRAKRPTARFFDVPEGSIAGILDRAGDVYGVEFDNDEWKIERARVEAGQRELEPLGETYADDADADTIHGDLEASPE